MVGSPAALMTAEPSGCVGIVGPRGRLRNNRTSVPSLRWFGCDFDRLCCSGVEVEVDGAVW